MQQRKRGIRKEPKSPCKFQHLFLEHSQDRTDQVIRQNCAFERVPMGSHLQAAYMRGIASKAAPDWRFRT